MTITSEQYTTEIDFQPVLTAKEKFAQLLNSAKENSIPLLPRALTEASTIERSVMYANSEKLFYAWIQLLAALKNAEFIYYVDDETFATYVTDASHNAPSIPATPLIDIEWIHFESGHHKLNTKHTTDYAVPADFLERFLNYIDVYISQIQQLDSEL